MYTDLEIFESEEIVVEEHDCDVRF